VPDDARAKELIDRRFGLTCSSRRTWSSSPRAREGAHERALALPQARRLLRELPPGHAVIEASAGTGKTYTLEHLVVDLVLKGARIGEVLVVTFTDKAAGEHGAGLRPQPLRPQNWRPQTRTPPG
jgi:hypothetical protein